MTPPAPTQTSSNNKGSGLCRAIGDTGYIDGNNMCQIAYHKYIDDHLYTQYTSYTFTTYNLANQAIDILTRGLGGYEGCAAMFKCNSNDAYDTGMTGKLIKDAFDNLYQNGRVKVCGSSYLSNGCHVTVNGCSECENTNVVCSTDSDNCATYNDWCDDCYLR